MFLLAHYPWHLWHWWILPKSRRPTSHSVTPHTSIQTMHWVSWNDITGSAHAPPLTNVSQNGTAPDAAIICQARPNSPDTGLVSRPDITWFTTANTWLQTENPAICTMSWMMYPAASPLPYWISNGWERFLSVVDEAAWRRAILVQPDVQLVLATQRSLWMGYN